MSPSSGTHCNMYNEQKLDPRQRQPTLCQHTHTAVCTNKHTHAAICTNTHDYMYIVQTNTHCYMYKQTHTLYTLLKGPTYQCNKTHQCMQTHPQTLQHVKTLKHTDTQCNTTLCKHRIIYTCLTFIENKSQHPFYSCPSFLPWLGNNK